MDQTRFHERSAPWYTIPSRQITSVEHPCMIKNIDKALETLHGEYGIAKLLTPPREDTPLTLTLRPEDAMARPLTSTSTPTNNVLLKVSVPKRTGRRRRKRERGTTGEGFKDVSASASAAKTEAAAGAANGNGGGKGMGKDGVQDTPAPAPAPAPASASASELQRILADNAGKYKVEAIGSVNRTHVFRGIPDFVFSTTASPFTSKFREKILPFEYEKLKSFTLDMTRGAVSNVDIIPPPAFSYNDLPFNYMYRQTATIHHTVDPKTGTQTTINTQRIPKVHTHLVPYDIPSVPAGPSPNCPPLENTDPTLQQTVSRLKELFSTRPAWTRRGLRNHLNSPDLKYVLGSALAYVGYTFRSGPWRDAIIKFGHDPRESPENRWFQTLMFIIVPPEGEEAGAGAESSGGGEWSDTSHGRRQNMPIVNDDKTPTPTPTPQPQPQPQPTSSTNPEESSTTPTPTHLFTGIPPLPRDGKMWMICDITDPILVRILSTPTIRTVCDPLSDGWYGNLTLAKIRTIMRAKIPALLSPSPERKVPADEDFQCILEFPEHVASDEELRAVVNVSVEGEGGQGQGQGQSQSQGVRGSKEIGLAAEMRAAVKTAPGRVRKGAGGWGGLHEKVNVNLERRKGRQGVMEEEGEGDGEPDYDEQDVFDGEGEGEREEANENDDNDDDGDPMDIAPG